MTPISLIGIFSTEVVYSLRSLLFAAVSAQSIGTWTCGRLVGTSSCLLAPRAVEVVEPDDNYDRKEYITRLPCARASFQSKNFPPVLLFFAPPWSKSVLFRLVFFLYNTS